MPWFDGRPLLDYLETVDVSRPETPRLSAMPVQLVLAELRVPGLRRHCRLWCGAGAHQQLVALPSGQRADVDAYRDR